MAADWNQKTRRFFQQVGLSFDEHLSVGLALTTNPLSEEFQQSLYAFQLPLLEYLRSVRVVGAEISSDNCPRIPLSIPQKQFIISIRGFPDLSLVRFIGTSLAIDPDVLLGHLPFSRTYQIPRLPSLPAASISIRMVSLGSYVRPYSTPADPRRQAKKDKYTIAHNENLFAQSKRSVDQYRRVNLHGSQFVSIEQQTTFVPIFSSGRAWSGIIFNDSGPRRYNLPYQGRHSKIEFPAFRTSGPLSLSPLPLPFESRRHPDPCQSRAINSFPMPESQHDLCTKDPMVFVIDLMSTSAISWRNLFSFLHEFHQCLGPDTEAKINTLRLDKSVTDRAERYFEDVLEFLHQPHALGWSGCSEDDSKAQVAQIVESMEADFMRLKSEAAALSKACSTAIGIEMSTMSAQLSKAGLDQAKQVQYLTILAFIFIPASFIAAVFALVFITPYPPMWKFIATLIPFTAFFIFVATWNLLANWLSALSPKLRARFMG